MSRERLCVAREGDQRREALCLDLDLAIMMSNGPIDPCEGI
jgi:hypothetical protein